MRLMLHILHKYVQHLEDIKLGTTFPLRFKRARGGRRAGEYDLSAENHPSMLPHSFDTSNAHNAKS